MCDDLDPFVRFTFLENHYVDSVAQRVHLFALSDYESSIPCYGRFVKLLWATYPQAFIMSSDISQPDGGQKESAALLECGAVAWPIVPV